tara:strand:+ start:995 stop:1111 length:117 start_codon:yes stop_codon:yes gene_type:complete
MAASKSTTAISPQVEKRYGKRKRTNEWRRDKLYLEKER